MFGLGKGPLLFVLLPWWQWKGEQIVQNVTELNLWWYSDAWAIVQTIPVSLWIVCDMFCTVVVCLHSALKKSVDLSSHFWHSQVSSFLNLVMHSVTLLSFQVCTSVSHLLCALFWNEIQPLTYKIFFASGFLSDCHTCIENLFCS